MGHADEALKLFLSKDIYEVNELTKKLNDYNKLRQEKEKSIYEEAVNQIEKNKLYEKCCNSSRRRKLAPWSNWYCIFKK